MARQTTNLHFLEIEAPPLGLAKSSVYPFSYRFCDAIGYPYGSFLELFHEIGGVGAFLSHSRLVIQHGQFVAAIKEPLQSLFRGKSRAMGYFGAKLENDARPVLHQF